MRKTLKSIGLVFVLFLSLLVLHQCATNPVTGKKELMLISESAEIALGKETDLELQAMYGTYDDPQLNAYVAGIGQKLAPLTHRPHLKYYFSVLDTPVENAFAAPGGYIYITRGLMAMMNSEAELAAVIGHELGHVAARHSARSISRSIIFAIGLAIASELSEKIRDVAPFAALAGQLLFLKFSRSDEYQADSLGILYASKAGFQAGEMVNFFNSIQRLSGEQGGVRLPNFLSTHPLTPKRIARVQELIKLPEYPTTPLLVERNPYLRKVNGLVYGDDPRQGYVENRTFYHPEMKFSFTIPNNWKVDNTPKQVQLTSADGKAIIMLSADNAAKDLDDYVDEKLTQLSKFNVLSQGFRDINGLRAFYKLVQTMTEQSAKEGEKKTEKPDINVQLTGIKKDNTIFHFFAAAQAGDYPSYRRDIENTVASFSNLLDVNRMRKKTDKVVIKQIKSRQSLGDYLKALAVPQDKWKRIALLNGIEIDTILEPNRLVKAIQ